VSLRTERATKDFLFLERLLSRQQNLLSEQSDFIPLDLAMLLEKAPRASVDTLTLKNEASELQHRLKLFESQASQTPIIDSKVLRSQHQTLSKLLENLQSTAANFSSTFETDFKPWIKLHQPMKAGIGDVAKESLEHLNQLHSLVNGSKSIEAGLEVIKQANIQPLLEKVPEDDSRLRLQRVCAALRQGAHASR